MAAGTSWEGEQRLWSSYPGEMMLRLSENLKMEVRTSASSLAHDLRAPKEFCLPSGVALPQCFVHLS